MNELIKINEPKIQLPVINFNVDQVKEQLKQALSKYDGLTFTENDVKDIKGVIAELNKAEKFVNDYRKDVKKEVSAPIVEFEDNCKELIVLINDTRKDFKDAATEIEDNRIAAKKIEVDELLQDMIDDSDLFEPYDAMVVSKPTYMNKGMTIKKIEADIYEEIEKLSQQQELVNQQKEIIEMYCVMKRNEFDVQIIQDPYIAMVSNRSVDEIKALIDAYIVKATEVIEEVIEEVVEEVKPVEVIEELKVIKPTVIKPIEKFTETWSITGTQEQMELLEDFMADKGIDYEVCE